MGTGVQQIQVAPPPRRQTLSTGPFKGVLDVVDPYEVTTGFLTDACNLYFPDVVNGAGGYARPGFTLQNSASQMGTKGQGQQCMITLDGTQYRFYVSSGNLYRANSTNTTLTSVTPVGMTIDSSPETRVFLFAFANSLIVSDGVNKPWVGTKSGRFADHRDAD